jgi:hypothetical protein
MWHVEGQTCVMCSDPLFLCIDLLLPVSVLDEVGMFFPHYPFVLVVQRSAESSPPLLPKYLIYLTSSSCVSSDTGT